MICLHCSKIDLQSDRKMSREGFGKCKQEPLVGRYISLSYNRECSHYEAAKDEIVNKRVEWNDRRAA